LTLPNNIYINIDYYNMTITETAKNKILTLKSEGNMDETHFVRVSVKGGGCSGLSYDLDFDNKINPSDQIFEDKGEKIVMDMKSFLYLAGTELDFSDGLNGKGFMFNNPNATRECGCGSSFSV